MTPLSAIITAAVADAVAGNPKLFDPKKIERAADVLSRDIVRALTRATKEDVHEAAPEADRPAYEVIPADDPRAIAYDKLRLIAGCFARPTKSASGGIYVPSAANTAAVIALASAPPRRDWRPVSRPQQTAWREFFDRVLGDASRHPVGDTTPLPWPWPPSKDGKLYLLEAAADQTDGHDAP